MHNQIKLLGEPFRNVALSASEGSPLETGLGNSVFVKFVFSDDLIHLKRCVLLHT